MNQDIESVSSARDYISAPQEFGVNFIDIHGPPRVSQNCVYVVLDFTRRRAQRRRRRCMRVSACSGSVCGVSGARSRAPLGMTKDEFGMTPERLGPAREVGLVKGMQGEDRGLGSRRLPGVALRSGQLSKRCRANRRSSLASRDSLTRSGLPSSFGSSP